jgi:hypothetical protein
MLEIFKLESVWVACLINSIAMIIAVLIFIDHSKLENLRHRLLLDEIDVRTVQNKILLNRIENLEKRVRTYRPTESTESTELIEHTESTETTEPTESTEPINSKEYIEFVNSKEYIEFTESTGLYKAMEAYCERTN